MFRLTPRQAQVIQFESDVTPDSKYRNTLPGVCCNFRLLEATVSALTGRNCCGGRLHATPSLRSKRTELSQD